MQLSRDAQILKTKAIASYTRAVTAFNSPQANGSRTTEVLLFTQHAFEMLLKAGLVHKKVKVFDSNEELSIGFEKCVRLGRDKLGLTAAEAGTLRAIDALRDAEQHWHCLVSEGILYTHMRAAVTLVDELLRRVFSDRLAQHMPERVLPISTHAPRDIQTLLDEEYSQIQQLLQPGRRRGAEARARIRTLIAIQAHAVDDLRVGEREVDRAVRAIRKGLARDGALPNLATVGTDITGDGINVTVHFTKTAGAPVTYISDGESAAAVSVVDSQKKYHWSRSKLADKLGLSWPNAAALRWHLDIDNDDSCYHSWTQGKTILHGYSDNALRRMKDALESTSLDIEEVRQAYQSRAKAT